MIPSNTRGGDPLTDEEEKHQQTNTWVGYLIFALIVLGVIIWVSVQHDTSPAPAPSMCERAGTC